MLSVVSRKVLPLTGTIPSRFRLTTQLFSAQAAAATATETIASATKASATSDRVRQRRRSLDPVIVTEAAATRLKELLDCNSEGALGIRLGTKKRGCNGLSYTLNYVKEVSEKDEPLTTSNGVKVFIEPMALMNVIGTTMDWVETELSAEFTFTNPNSKGECGCGESFNV